MLNKQNYIQFCQNVISQILQNLDYDEEFTLDNTFDEIGLDSMSFIDFVCKLEDKYLDGKMIDIENMFTKKSWNRTPIKEILNMLYDDIRRQLNGK